MEFDLHPTVSLQTGTFSAVIAPGDVVLAGLNDNPVLQKFLFLFISGNFSRLLSGINRRSVNIEVRRAFTAFQLLHILKESYHTVVFVEHDPTLYEGAEDLAVTVAQALRETGEAALVVLYAPKADPSFDEMSRFAHRVFYLGASPPTPPPSRTRHRPGKSRHPAGLPRGQTTLEGI
ncbi:MAG TPA: hypothetical protein VMW63_11335 [Methanoregulaceae archaeon]|nr:hypothetical protein [Methanoregulaceae archaeon]